MAMEMDESVKKLVSKLLVRFLFMLRVCSVVTHLDSWR